MVKCPVCGMMVDEATAPSLEYQGKKYFFMSPDHKEMFEQDPDKYGEAAGSMSEHKMASNTQSDKGGGCCG